MTLRILHVSDLHFGPPFLPEVGEALLREAEALTPDAVVVSGDLTQRARAEQFRDARAFLERLPEVPRLVIPGNHDVPLWRVGERMLDPRGLYREYISEQLDPVLRLDGAVLAGLDSTSPRRAISNGRIHVGQLDHCDRVFADAPPEAVRIVVAHHHFAPAPDSTRDRAMPRSRRAIDRFVRLGVELILGGHLHRGYIGNTLDLYPGIERDRGIIIVQCGTSTSRRGRAREREKNSINVVEIDAETILVTHFLYFEDRNRFAPSSRHLFPRPGRTLGDVDPGSRRP